MEAAMIIICNLFKLPMAFSIFKKIRFKTLDADMRTYKENTVEVESILITIRNLNDF